ncbi:MAG: EF-hand domain-containing protein [Planctomycetes bacterium]|nr:EF-hand domain-containing protein [Planctomycetota bacterium]
MKQSFAVRPILVLLALSGASRAQDLAQAIEQLFAAADRDKSGYLERLEFAGSDEQFAEVDVNKDKKLAKDELAKSDLVRRYLATMRRDDGAPRARVDADALALRRLQALKRFDPNQDGRVTRAEWQGDEGAFRELDLDGDGVLDGGDREVARKRLDGADTEPVLPEFKSALEGVEELVRRMDDDHDGELTRAEVKGTKVDDAFEWADRNRDGKLDPQELQRLVSEVARFVERRNRGNGRVESYRVPFGTWDKNGDGRIETGEWQGPAYLFPRIDQDRDAALTELEIRRYARSVEGRTFAERFDLNDDGRVTQDEFGGPPDAFRRFDRNGDGVVTSADR